MRGFKDVRDFLYAIQKNKDGGLKTYAGDGDRKNVLDLKILVGVDVSGSISPGQYRQFMRQIDRIKGLSVIKVMEADTGIVALYNYRKTAKSRVARLGGGGGTDFKEAFTEAKKLKPDAILFMTDGYVSNSGVGDPGIPTGWVLTDPGVQPYDFGNIVVRLPGANA
jgi:predicted metal-dependent peptidase